MERRCCRLDRDVGRLAVDHEEVARSVRHGELLERVRVGALVDELHLQPDRRGVDRDHLEAHLRLGGRTDNGLQQRVKRCRAEPVSGARHACANEHAVGGERARGELLQADGGDDGGKAGH